MGSKPVGSFYVQLGLNTENFRRNLEYAQRDLRAAFGTAAIHASEVLAASIGAIGAAMAALGAKAVKMAADLEKQHVALTRLLGSEEKATKKIVELQKFASKSGFGVEELIDYQKRLMAVGFNAEETSYLLHNMADASAALGLTGVGIDRLIKAFGDVKAKGSLQTQEMKQFAEVGIPAWDMLAEAMGKSRAELTKMVEARQISASDFLNAINDQMIKRWGGMMVEQSKTVTGAWNRMENAIKVAMIDIGKYLTDNLPIKEALNALANFADNVREIFQDKSIWNVIMEFYDQFPILADMIWTLSVNLSSLLLPALSSVGSFLMMMLAPLAGIYIKMLAIGLIVKDVVKGIVDGKSIVLSALDVVLIGFETLLKDAKIMFLEWSRDGQKLIGDFMQTIIDKGYDALNAIGEFSYTVVNTALRGISDLITKYTSEFSSNFLFETAGIIKLAGYDEQSERIKNFAWNIKNMKDLYSESHLVWKNYQAPNMRIYGKAEEDLLAKEKKEYDELIEKGATASEELERVVKETADEIKKEYDSIDTLWDKTKNLFTKTADEWKNFKTKFGQGNKETFGNDAGTTKQAKEKAIKENFGDIGIETGNPLTGLVGYGFTYGKALSEEFAKIVKAHEESEKLRKSIFDLRVEIANGLTDAFVTAMSASGNFFHNLGEGFKKLGDQILKQIAQMLIFSAILRALGINYSVSGFNVSPIFSEKPISGGVGDGIVSDGKIITTHPDDYIIATKDPSSLGGKANVVVNVNNNSSSEVSTNSYFDGTKTIVDIVIDGINRDVGGLKTMLRSI